jgi:hypothetical protein
MPKGRPKGSGYLIFISHTPKDAEYAAKLRNLLSARRDVRLLSTDTLSAGENWRAELRDALVNTDLFVVILSPDSLASPWVLQELGSAWTLGKPILAVVAGTKVPMKLPVALDEHQFVSIRDFRKPEDFDRWLEHAGTALTAAK